MKLFVRMILLAIAMLATVVVVNGQDLTIEITKGVEGAIPIAIAPFATQNPTLEDIGAIVSADLQRSGRFETLLPPMLLSRPATINRVDFPSLRTSEADFVVVGQVQPGSHNNLQVQFQLAEVFEGNQLLGYSFAVPTDELRRVAHHISDLIYEQLTNERGAFNTRIAYVSVIQQPNGNSKYSLVVADADGYNPQVVLRSADPIMSPVWSPEGNRLAYVSFEGQKSQIVVQDVYSGVRQIVSQYPGINGAPAWSPDGQRLAYTLSKDDNPEIYINNLASGNLTRLTYNNAIDTEPVWSPDGKSIVFTSDRGGSPQLYLLPLNGGEPQRLTFAGDYNADATFAPDGRSLAMVHRLQGQFHIAVMDLQNRQLRVLTQGGLDESPSFAPNGSMIIYATSQGGRGVLAAVSVDGRIEQSLASQGGDVREPAWSPYGS